MNPAPPDAASAPALQIPDNARCLGCGYLLRGLTTPRCPECGRAFNPGDRSSMAIGSPMGKFATAIYQPTGRLVRTATLWSAIATIWGSALLPGADYLAFIASICVESLCCYQLIRFVLREIVRLVHRKTRANSPQSRSPVWRRAIVALALVNLIIDWPLVLSLWIHKPLLRAFCHNAYAQRPALDPPSCPRFVGALLVDRLRVTTTGVILHVAGSDQYLNCNFVGPSDEFVIGKSEGYPWGWMISNHMNRARDG
jgi:hypothetical protein